MLFLPGGLIAWLGSRPTGDGDLIVDEEAIRQIKSARVRRRVLALSVRYDQYEKKVRCPMRLGGVYTLVPASPVTHKRRQAERDAWRAQAVLDFIDLVNGARRTEKQLSLVVTVTGEPFEGAPGVWFVPIMPGDHSGQNDRALFLSGMVGASSDYTTTAARQAVPGDPEVMFPSEADIEKARIAARGRRSASASLAVRVMRDQAETCEGVMTSMKARNRVKLIRKELAKLEDEVSAGPPA